MNLSFFPRRAASRTRSSACDTLSRSCARRVLCWFAFPSVPVLGSTGSAADCSALFAGFTATTTESDFSGSCIIGYGSSPFRCGPAVSIRGPNPRPPGSRTRSFHTCQGLRPRRVGRTLAMTRPSMLPSVKMTTSAPGIVKLSRASRPAEFHRQPLSEPSVKLSPHWAPIRRTSRSYRVSSVRRSPGTPQPAA